MAHLRRAPKVRAAKNKVVVLMFCEENRNLDAKTSFSNSND